MVSTRIGKPKTLSRTSGRITAPGAPSATTRPSRKAMMRSAVDGGMVEVVQDDDDAAAGHVGHMAQRAHQFARIIDVEIVERFVEQDVVRALGEAHRRARPLPLPARQGVDEAVAYVRQIEGLERRVDKRMIGILGPALVMRESAELDQFPDPQATGDAVVLRHHREQPGQGPWSARAIHRARRR